MLNTVRVLYILHTYGSACHNVVTQLRMLHVTLDEFDAALSALGWKVSEFCRATGLHRNTPSRWRNEGVEIPAWVPQHLGLLLDLKRLQAAHVVPPSPRAGGWYLQDLQGLQAAYLVPPTGDE